jgi:nucleotide-binding universal stress UspA family protein
MYKKILIAIENSHADRTVLEHVQQLATLTGASLLLVHVADGWVARHYDELALRESEEMKADRAYLEKIQADLVSRGFPTQTHLAMGDPATELVRVADAEHPD